MSVVTVVVAGREHQYPEMIAEYGDFVAAGGRIESIANAQVEAKRMFRTVDWVRTVIAWVTIDDSGCAYRVEIRESGSYSITGAAPTTRRQECYYA